MQQWTARSSRRHSPLDGAACVTRKASDACSLMAITMCDDYKGRTNEYHFSD